MFELKHFNEENIREWAGQYEKGYYRFCTARERKQCVSNYSDGIEKGGRPYLPSITTEDSVAEKIAVQDMSTDT